MYSHLFFMLELHAYMRIPTPLIVRGSPAPATVFNPSTQSIGLSLSLGMSNGFQRSFEINNIYSLQQLLNQHLKLIWFILYDYYSFILPTWFGLLGCSFRFGGKFLFDVYGSYGKWQTEGLILYNQLRTLSFLGTDVEKGMNSIESYFSYFEIYWSFI